MAVKAYKRTYTKLQAITKATVSLNASGVANDELATVGGKLAQIVKTQGDLVTLQVLSGTEGGYEQLAQFCREESVGKASRNKIGFFTNSDNGEKS